MQVTLRAGVKDATVLADEARDRAVLTAEVTVFNEGDEALLVAPDKFQFELSTREGARLTELSEHVTRPAGAAHQTELSPGKKVALDVPLLVGDYIVEPDRPYKLTCHAFGETSQADFQFS
ncbi:MAG: hypothetical protein KY476_20805 [Planctomycetes bacterium]|nr:hypothetical protein [Planctomycetota bacterium]